MTSRVWPTLLSDTPASNGGGLSFPAVPPVPAALASVPSSMPVELARLHRATAVSALVEVHAPADLLAGAGFDSHGRRLRTLADTVGPAMKVLVCGLNPSLYSADAGYGFARPSNRFWKAAVASGLVGADRARDPFRALLEDGMGMTDLVKRATVAASELTLGEYRAGAARVERVVGWLRPPTILFVGLAGWRAVIDRHAFAGWQPATFGGARAYVMPSTSGLNARTTLDILADHMRAALRGLE